MSLPETYQVVCLSTAHLCDLDCEKLREMEDDDGCNMVMSRDTGWFIKLYPESASNWNTYGNTLSPPLFGIILEALNAGYSMIEFDRDAAVNPGYPIFEY